MSQRNGTRRLIDRFTLLQGRDGSWSRVPKPAPARMVETANSADTPENAAYWRRAGKGRRDLEAFQHARAIEVAFDLLRREGLACRMAQAIDEWCVGDGIVLASNLKDEGARERHQEALDAVWAEPQTHWESLQHDIARTLAPVGEMLFSVHAPPTGVGDAAFGCLDPATISAVVLNRQNARQTVAVIIDGPSGADKVYCPEARFVAWAKENEDAATLSGGWPLPEEGGEITIATPLGRQAMKRGPEVLYFPHNRMVGATRGISLLYPIADLLDAFDSSIWQQMEGVSVRNTCAMLVKGGANDDAVNRVVDAITAKAGRGGVTVGTTSDVTVEAAAPSLGSLDFAAHLETIVKRISATTAFPVTWLGLGTDAGNAATTELAGPALRMLKNLQAEIRCVVEAIVGLAMTHKAKEASLDPEEAQDFTVQMTDIGGRDSVRNAAVLGQLGVFVETGVASRAWTTEKGGAMLRRMATELMDETFEEDDIPDPEEGEEDPGLMGAPGEDGEEDPGEDGDGPAEGDEAGAKRDADDMARLRRQGRKA